MDRAPTFKIFFFCIIIVIQMAVRSTVFASEEYILYDVVKCWITSSVLLKDYH